MTDQATVARPVISRRPDRYSINTDRAVEVLDVAVDFFTKGKHPFGQDHWILPEHAVELPPEITNDPSRQALFYFWACMFMRGKIKSTQAIQRLLRLYESERDLGHANILEPSIAITLSQDYIGQVLKTYGLYGSYARGWLINAHRLLERYDGDILKAFADVTNYRQAYVVLCHVARTKAGFWGFKRKMASMLLYYLFVAGLFGQEDFPPPVDWHHISLAERVGIVDLLGNVLDGDADLEDGACEDMREVYLYYMARRGVSTIVLARTFWLLSAYLCMMAPGNQIDEQGEEAARSTTAVYTPPDWTQATPKMINDYLQSCAICPLRQWCDKLMPSFQWYTWGKLGALEFPRTEPTQEEIDAVILFNPYELEGNKAAPKPKPAPKQPLVAPPPTEPMF